jgi:hypothetical protein
MFFKQIATLLLAGGCAVTQAAPASAAPPSFQGSLAERIGQSLQHSTDRAAQLAATAMTALGLPYRRGGNSPETGFDCSGLVRFVTQQVAGIALPRTAAAQAQATDKIQKNDLRPGDLIFFNTRRRAFSHVGIYVGDGKFIHSPRSGQRVRVESLEQTYWKKRFNGARRIAFGNASIPLAPPEPAATAAAVTTTDSALALTSSYSIARDLARPGSIVRLDSGFQKPLSAPGLSAAQQPPTTTTLVTASAAGKSLLMTSALWDGPGPNCQPLLQGGTGNPLNVILGGLADLHDPLGLKNSNATNWQDASGDCQPNT